MHSCSVSPFWTRLVPQLAHRFEPVKHALMALGATHHMYKLGTVQSDQYHIASHEIEQLELFAMRQYNKAIATLNQAIERGEDEPESIALVLICCMLFISLELLSRDHQKAVLHLKCGIQIITSSVVVEQLDQASGRVWRAGSALSEADLWSIITQFRNSEYVLSGFVPQVPLALARRLYKLSCARRKGGLDPEAITSVAESYDARIHYVNMVLNCAYELRTPEGRSDEEDSSRRALRLQQQRKELHRQGTAMMDRIKALWSAPGSPPVGTWESYSIRLDWLALASARLILDLLPHGANAATIARELPHVQDVLSTLANKAEELMLTHDAATGGRPPSDFTLDTGLIALMYWILKFSSRSDTKATALRILRKSKNREGPWNANLVLSGLKERPVAPRILGGWQTSA